MDSLNGGTDVTAVICIARGGNVCVVHRDSGGGTGWEVSVGIKVGMEEVKGEYVEIATEGVSLFHGVC